MMGRKKGCRMSTRITHQADGTARGQTQQNTANSIIDLRKQPARQKNAREYLAGRSPGVMQSYAPNAAAPQAAPRPAPLKGEPPQSKRKRLAPL